MIRRLIIVIILILASYGVSLAEIDIAKEESWQKAWDQKHADKAIVELFSSFEIEINRDGSYTEKVHFIERIQNERGMIYGEIPIAYDNRYEKIKKIKAYTITPDGKRYRCRKIQDIDTSVEAYYSDTRKKVISMSNVIPGSIIDIEYEKFHNRGVIKGEYFCTWVLSDIIPRKYQILIYSVPEDMAIYFKYIRIDKRPKISKKNGRIIYRWEFKNDECYDEELIEESFTVPQVELVPYLCISTMKDWSELGDWIRQVYSKNIILTDEIKTVIRQITKDKESLQEKIEAITKYLRDNFRYVAMMLAEHNLEPHPAYEVFQNKFGDCKDQSILLITMLKELGMKSYPVLVRDYKDGDIREFLPSPNYFNHVIVAVELEGKLYFVDPLIEGYRIDEIPYGLEGDYVFIVTDKNSEFMQLPFMHLSQKTVINNNNIYLRDDGSAVIELKYIADRNESINLRKNIRLSTQRAAKDFIEFLENLTKGGELIDYSVNGIEDKYGLLTLRLKSQVQKYTKLFGPIMIFGYDSTSFSDIFYQKERKYPIWFNTEAKTIEITEYVIPEDFSFEYIPDNVSLNSDWMKVTVRYIRKNRNIIRKEKSLHYKIAIISPERYQEVKDFLCKVDEKLQECIIIKRKERSFWQRLTTAIHKISRQIFDKYLIK
jgi:transglutaminase-like putative cysteine protease